MGCRCLFSGRFRSFHLFCLCLLLLGRRSLSHLHLLLLFQELLLILSLSLGLHLHLMQFGLSVLIAGIGLVHQALNISGTSILLLLLHLKVLHLLGGSELLLLQHLLVLDGSRVFLSGHLILLLVALRSVLHEMRVLRGLHNTEIGAVRHVVFAGRNVLALVAVVKFFALNKSQ